MAGVDRSQIVFAKDPSTKNQQASQLTMAFSLLDASSLTLCEPTGGGVGAAPLPGLAGLTREWWICRLSRTRP
jgi:hypothetical protein